jgi:acetyltransferase-like isoleucine patch superfamily enzyme
VRGAARATRRAWGRVRFALWARRLDLRLRRNGSRLVLECSGGDGGAARFVAPPRVEVPLRVGGVDGALSDAPAGRFVLRLAPGASLGRDLVLSIGTRGESVLELGHSTWIGDHCRIELDRGAIRIGAQAQVRDQCALKCHGEIVVGDRTILSRGVIIHANESVRIGEHTGIGERTSIIDNDHVHDGSDRSFYDQELLAGPIEIGRNVVVGAGCVILRGVRVGSNAVVGAGSVVLGGEHPGGWLIAGAPAVARRRLGSRPGAAKE